MTALPLGLIDGPAFELLDDRFAACTVPEARVERLWTGGAWTEGPVWMGDAILWSDIPSDRILRWSEEEGSSLFRHPSRGANGNTRDREGRLVTCEGAGRAVTRTEPDGAVTVLADRHDGRRLNAPNDVVVTSDGAVWFTDPAYGPSARDDTREIDGCHVYRIDPDTADVAQVVDDMLMPNGLAFSPDESVLYIIDTGHTHHEGGPDHIRRFEVVDGRTLRGGEVFADAKGRHFDGLRLDTTGRLWCGSEDGAHVFHPDGALLGYVRLPERAANLAFGGGDGGTLFLTGTTSLYRVPVATRPAVP